MDLSYEETDQKYWESTQKYFIEMDLKFCQIGFKKEETPQNQTFEGFPKNWDVSMSPLPTTRIF